MSFPDIYSFSSNNSYDNFSLFNSYVGNFLINAHELADNIVHPRIQCPFGNRNSESREAAIYYALSYPSYHCGNKYSLFNFHINRPLNEDRREFQKVNDIRAFLTAIGTVVAGVADYFVSQPLYARKFFDENLIDIAKFKKVINCEPSNPQHPHLQAIRKVIECEQNIFNKMHEQTGLSLAMLVTAAVASTFMFLGGVLASEAAMTVGLLVGVGTLLTALFNYTVYQDEKVNIERNAKSMLTALEALRNAHSIIPNAFENMENQHGVNYPPVYTSKHSYPKCSDDADNGERFQKCASKIESSLPLVFTQANQQKIGPDTITPSQTTPELVPLYPAPIVFYNP